MAIMTLRILPAYFLVIAALQCASTIVMACPFCDAPAQTLSEETTAADAVVLASLTKEAPPVSEPGDPNSGTATFEVIEVLRGKEKLGDAKEIKAVYFGESDKEGMFLISGLGTEQLDWTTPLPLTKASEDYVRKLPTLPASGADRLAFFQEYLEHKDPLWHKMPTTNLPARRMRRSLRLDRGCTMTCS
jgi:hypothetical protein